MTYYFKHPWLPSEILFSGKLFECVRFGWEFFAMVEEEEDIKIDFHPLDCIVNSEEWEVSQ